MPKRRPSERPSPYINYQRFPQGQEIDLLCWQTWHTPVVLTVSAQDAERLDQLEAPVELPFWSET